MNGIQIVGRLTKDPEFGTTKAGQDFCRMRVAVPRPGSEVRPVYIDVVAWGRVAQTCALYRTQGRQVAVIGWLDYVEWTDADGTRHSRHEIVARAVDFFGQSTAKNDETE